jgi:hypothetical protein
MRVGLSPMGETCTPIGMWASSRQSDCRKRAAARKRVSVLMKPVVLLEQIRWQERHATARAQWDRARAVVNEEAR